MKQSWLRSCSMANESNIYSRPLAFDSEGMSSFSFWFSVNLALIFIWFLFRNRCRFVQNSLASIEGITIDFQYFSEIAWDVMTIYFIAEQISLSSGVVVSMIPSLFDLLISLICRVCIHSFNFMGFTWIIQRTRTDGDLWDISSPFTWSH